MDIDTWSMALSMVMYNHYVYLYGYLDQNGVRCINYICLMLDMRSDCECYGGHGILIEMSRV